jgi:hypothetical protein
MDGPETMRFRAFCVLWTEVPSTESSAVARGWCEDMMRGMRPRMNGNWELWDDGVSGPMMGG